MNRDNKIIQLAILFIVTFAAVGTFDNMINTNKNHKEVIQSQNKIIQKQDSIIDINMKFQKYHLDNCAFQQIEK